MVENGGMGGDHYFSANPVTPALLFSLLRPVRSRAPDGSRYFDRLVRKTPPDASPPVLGAAPTGGFFGLGARGRDYRMTTGRWDRGRAAGGNILTRLRVIR